MTTTRVYFPEARVVTFAPIHGPLTPTPNATLVDVVQRVAVDDEVAA